MITRSSISRALAVLTLTTAATAQTWKILPTPLAQNDGKNSNIAPFLSPGDTYQQVHDASEMAAIAGGPSLTLLGIGFRKDGDNHSLTVARTVDVQLTVNTTPITSRTITSTFAANLGPNATVVHPFARVNIPALVNEGRPSPIRITIPFNVPYPFVVGANNNFVWEMRTRNNSSQAWLSLDAESGDYSFMTEIGRGCDVWPLLPFHVAFTRMTTGRFDGELINGPANAPAILFVGAQAARTVIPGLCAPIEVVPLFALVGTTNATGSLRLGFGTGTNLIGSPQVHVYSQYAFADARFPLGVGVTAAADVLTPRPELSRISTLMTPGARSGTGSELATTGTTFLHYGLVTGLLTP